MYWQYIESDPSVECNGSMLTLTSSLTLITLRAVDHDHDCMPEDYEACIYTIGAFLSQSSRQG